MKETGKSNAQIVVFIVIAMLVLGGGLYVYRKMRRARQAVETAQTAPTTAPSPEPTATPVKETNSLSPGNTNTDLDQDLKTIDGKMGSVNSSASDIDTSIQGQSADTQNITQ